MNIQVLSSSTSKPTSAGQGSQRSSPSVVSYRLGQPLAITLVSDVQGSDAMGDDNKGKSSAESLAEVEKEHRELKAALVKKLDVLSSLEDRLGRIEHA